MTAAVVVLPILAPMLGAVLALLLRGHRAQRAVWLAAHAAHLVAAAGLLSTVLAEGIAVTRMGAWPAPFGIAFVADRLAALLVMVTAVVGAAVGCYAALSPRPAPTLAPLMLMLLTGVCGAFVAGDLFNLYVWFEVLLISSFVLLAHEGRPAPLAGALRYVAINLVSSALFLTALGLLYAKAGTLDLADLARLAASDREGALGGVAVLLMVAFGIKAGVFPLFGWLPPAYPTPAPVVSALFAGLLTKVGVYALMRVFTLVFVHDTGFTHGLLLMAGALTMGIGVLGAASRAGIRRILSFHIISQIGYIVVGLALYTPFAIGASVFYLVHHIVVKTALFLVGGLVAEAGGSEELSRLGGLRRVWPALWLVFAIPALSLAGMPPLSGFFAKVGIIRAAFDAGAPGVGALALGVGLLTLFSMLKIAHAAFLGPAADEARPPRPVGRARLWPVAALAAISVAVGLLAGPVFEVCLAAGEALFERSEYLQAGAR
ncbi:MAG: proton-conducting transporter membrane subunit [bacterium]